jgi:Tol biopolymer transport system component
VADVDGSHPRLLHDGPITFADWSPDGARIAFSGPTAGGHHVSILDIASGSVVDLGPGDIPRWSPDGDRLAIASHGFTAVEIVCVADSRREILATGVTGGAPVWSPDGAWVAFSSTSVPIPAHPPQGLTHPM